MAKYYLFRSSDHTHKECLDRMLVGQTMRMKSRVFQVQSGDIIFIHKTSNLRAVRSQFIEGPFLAISRGQENIVKEAWNGMFPIQVKIEKKFETIKISKESFESFSLHYVPGLKDLFFDFEIPTSIGRKLMQEIGFNIDIEKKQIKDSPLNEDSVDFRLKYPAQYRTDDGHFVRSRGEVMIDNWLYSNKILHVYERRIPDSKFICDFYIPNVDLFIEYWGLTNNKEYEKHRIDKIKHYNSKKLKILSIFDKDLNDLDSFLRDKLK